MRPDIKLALQNLPRLAPGSADVFRAACKLCGHPAPLFDITDFNKFCSADCFAYGLSGVIVPYVRCSECNFIFTTFFDDWTPDDFRQHIYNEDYVKVDGEYLNVRPARTAEQVGIQLQPLKDLRFLDFGGGAGVFAEQMRKMGFDRIESYDPFAQPIRPEGKFDIVFSFEVVEHSPTPNETFADIFGFLSEGGAAIIGTNLQPPDIEKTRLSWWYAAPRNGHVSLYSIHSMCEIARRFKANFSTYGGTHFFCLGGPESMGAEAARLMGVQQRHLIVLRPGAKPGEADGWYGEEPYGTLYSFCWSRLSVLRWLKRPLPSGTVTIRTRVLMQVGDGFASEAYFTIDGTRVPTQFDGEYIAASIDNTDFTIATIELHTPEPTRPANPLEGRKLGLAIAAGELAMGS